MKRIQRDVQSEFIFNCKNVTNKNFLFFLKKKKGDTQYQAMVTFDSLFQNELQQSVNASMKMEYILSFYPNGILYVA